MKAGNHAYMIAVVNSKGGVGKSTLAVHLASWLYGRGRAVTFIDADVQGSSAAWLREAEPKVPVVSLHTAAEILRRVPALKAEPAENMVLGGAVLVADGCAGLAAETRALMVTADAVLIPCGASALDLRAAALAVGVVREAEQARGAALKAWLVLNRLQGHTRLGAEAVEAAGKLGVKLAHPPVSLRTCLADAAGQGSVVFRMGAAARSAAAELNALFEGLEL